MKKPMGMVSALAMASAAAFGGISDRVVVFSTPGPDRYADGSKVLDGECYALVWSPVGEVFGGFNADGTAVNAADRVVLAGALAKNGKCMEAIFQVPEDRKRNIRRSPAANGRYVCWIPVGMTARSRAWWTASRSA